MAKIFFFITLFCSIIFFCVSGSDLMEESENRILKFRADVDQIGVDFENFFFDLIMEWMKSYEKAADPLGIYKDQKALTAAQDFVKQYTEQIKKLSLTPASPTSLPLNNMLQESFLKNIAPKPLSLPQTVPSITRLRRDTDSTNFVETSENSVLPCDSKSQHERKLEQMHLEDLKQEVDKLKNIVYLLKSQQKTVSSLDGIVSPMKEVHTKNVLNFLKSNSSATSNGISNPIHEELSNLKNDLRQTISLLNATRAFLVADQQEGLSLKNEIKKLNEDLEEMKMMIRKMYRSNNNSVVSSPGELLGAPVHLPKPLPVSVMQKSRQNVNTEQNDDVNSKARSSDLDKIIKELNKQNEVPTELNKLQEILKRNRERENMKTLLQKLTNPEKPSGRDLLSDDVDVTNQLKKLVKALDQSQGRIEDDDVELDLKQLENAINSLQPQESSKKELKGLDNDGLIKLLLVDLLERRGIEGKNDGHSQSISGSLSLTPQQIADLRKRLDKLATNGNKPKAPQLPPIMGRYENVPFPSPYAPPNPYGMFLPPYPYQFSYGANMHQPPNDFNEQFGNIPSNNPYIPMTVSPEVPPTPLSYPDSSPVNPIPNYQTGVTNQFFPNSRPYEKYDANNIPPPEIVNGGYPVQSGAYQQAGPNLEDYKTKTVQQLKDDIGNLNQYVGGLKNNPKYSDGQDMIPKLENQINELQQIIYNLDHDASVQPTEPKIPPVDQHYAYEPRMRRSAETPTGSQLYDDMVTKLKDYLFNPSTTSKERTSHYDNVQDRLNNIMSQLGHHDYSYQPYQPFQPPAYHLPHFPSLKDDKKDTVFDLIESKKGDLIASIIVKIFDGLLKSLPKILEKLFGNGLYQLLNFNDGYDYNNYHSVYDTTSDVRKLLGNFGLVGYGPLVFLKIIDGFTTLVKILKKNKFFKNFLVPAGLILLIAGSAVFLVWWLQPDSYEQYGSHDVSNYYAPHPSPQYTYNAHGYDHSYNNYVPNKPYTNQPVYNHNKDMYGGKQYYRSYYDDRNV